MVCRQFSIFSIETRPLLKKEATEDQDIFHEANAPPCDTAPSTPPLVDESAAVQTRKEALLAKKKQIREDLRAAHSRQPRQPDLEEGFAGSAPVGVSP